MKTATFSYNPGEQMPGFIPAHYERILKEECQKVGITVDIVRGISMNIPPEPPQPFYQAIQNAWNRYCEEYETP